MTQNVFNCFEDGINNSSFDKKPWKFSHKLLNHPALELSNLEKVVQRLPEDQVMFSSGELKKTDNFDAAHKDKTTGLSLKDTIENIKTSKSYVMVRSPEVDESFKGLYEDIKADISKVLKNQNLSPELIAPKLFLFIASPGSITPFHVDRYSTFLMQLRGNKKVVIYPNDEYQVVKRKDVEAFMAFSGERPVYSKQMDEHANEFDFGPGESIHIPFMAPHLVENGLDDVSVSLSIIFKNKNTEAASGAMAFNHRARKLLKPLGLKTIPSGKSLALDSFKSVAVNSFNKLRS